MGERQNDGGPAGRRRVHPEGTPPARSGGPGPTPVGRAVVDADGLEALLAAALIHEGVDPGAEQRAVAAYRAARESGAHGARTRRRDNWRARGRRLGSHSLKATLSVLVAGLTLSGVAVAAIGAAGSSTDDPPRDIEQTHAPSRATTAPESAAPDAGSGRPEPDRPGIAQDTEAQCRAYEQVGGRGKALDSTAWKRLTEAAGGAAHVDAYCAEQGDRETVPPGSTGSTGSTGITGTPGKNTGGADGAENGGDAGDHAAREAENGPEGSPGTDPGSEPGDSGNGPGGSAGKPAEPGARNP